MAIVNIVSPSENDQYLEGESVPLSITTSDFAATVNQIEVYADGTLIDNSTSSPLNSTWSNASHKRDNDALLHLRFDGNVVDYSPNSNNCLILNAENSSYIAGQKQQAISLGNHTTHLSRSCVLIPSKPAFKSIGNAFSVAFWVRATPGQYHMFFSNKLELKNGFEMYSISDGRIDCMLNGDLPEEDFRLRSDTSSSGDGKFNDTTFKHFCWTYDGTNFRVYVDSVLKNSMIAVTDIQSDSDWFLNSNTAISPARGDADYDDLRIYDYAIDQAKVTEIYNDNPTNNVLITARANDGNGWVDSSVRTISVNKENQPPISIIKNPIQNSEYEEGDNIVIQVTAGDPEGSISDVEILDNGNLIATLSQYPYDYVWNTAPLGQHSITARTTDSLSLETVSDPVIMNVGLMDLTPRVLKRVQRATIISDAGLDKMDDPNRPRYAIDDASMSKQAADGMEDLHISVETNIVRTPGLISNRFEVDINYPRPYASGETLTYRSELRTAFNRIVNQQAGWYSISYYWDENQIPDKDAEAVMQWHLTGVFAFPVLNAWVRDGMLNWQVRWADSGFENTMMFCTGPTTPGEWQDFIFYVNLSNDPSKGRFKLWKNRKLARCYNPYTGQKWIVPTGIDVENYPYSHATGPEKTLTPIPTVIEDGQEVSVVDWTGKTSYVLPAVVDIYRKWGIYKHGWNYVDPENPLSSGTDTINRVLYIANTNFTSPQYQDKKIFSKLDADGLNALDGIDYNDYTPAATITNLNNGYVIPTGDNQIIVSLGEPSEPITEITLHINGSLVYTSNSKDFTYDWLNVSAGSYDIYTIVTYPGIGYIQSDTITVSAEATVPGFISVRRKFQLYNAV